MYNSKVYMSYLALYRKYRSKNFDELVGQDAIKRTLTNALKSGKISHAYLFSGPRGTGKTSVARLFAKALNCEEGYGHICNECSNCIAINDGSHPDIIEIDAASNSGVEEVRTLIEQVKYGPIKGKKKVYIIDEVHMMTNSAFNALLKTLEEPPEYCVFILCTTEPYKLLPTILSRCQRYEFKKICDDDLKKLLVRVLLEEHVTCSDGALKLIIELSNGGARDSLSLLDQIISYCGNSIDEPSIIKMFGLTTVQEKIDLLKAIKAQNTLQVLTTYESFINRHVDLSRFVNELLFLLKDSLVYSKTRSKDLITNSKEDDAKQIMLNFSDGDLTFYIDNLIKCQNDFKTANNPAFLFEIYLLKLIKGENGILPNNNGIISRPQIKEVVQPVPDRKVVSLQEDTKKTFEEAPLLKEVQEKEISSFKQEPLPVVPEVAFKISKSSLSLSPLKIEGDSNKVELQRILEITIIANRAERISLIERWQQLNTLLDDPEQGPYASLLLESKPYILTQYNLVLLCDLKAPAIKINIIDNQENIAKLVKKLLGRKVCVYALNRDDSTQLMKTYRNLEELRQLPKKDTIEDKKLF